MNRHLPAGQHMQGASGGISGADMGHGPGVGGSRRRQPQYMPQYQQQMNPPVYPNYPSYSPQQYYGIPPQYNNPGVPSPGYMNHQAYGRSPPNIHQYVPMAGVSVAQNYPRHSQQSPSLATPYQPPSAPAPVPSQTPSSTHSSQMIPPPTPPTPQTVERATSPPPKPVESVFERSAFRPPLPWFSSPESAFPKRAPRSRIKRRLLPANGATVSLPEQQVAAVEETSSTISTQSVAPEVKPALSTEKSSTKHDHPVVQPIEIGEAKSGAAAISLPILACQSPIATVNGHVTDNISNDETSVNDLSEPTARDSDVATEPVINSIPIKAAPSSWAKLFSSPPAQNIPRVNGADGATAIQDVVPESVSSGSIPGSNFALANKSSLAEVIRNFRVDDSDKASLIEPRGLINTGNMCYMNSVLQVLIFCVPFYDFLEQLRQKAVHSFKSQTPLVDVLVVFMQEFKVLVSSTSTDQLRGSVRPETFERHGEPFTPEFVYDAIRQLSRFASMEVSIFFVYSVLSHTVANPRQHGHQQDAEEFLGFLLQTLDDECTHIMNKSIVSELQKPGSNSPRAKNGDDPSGDWLEVGRKQKAAVTRSSGSNSSTPITKIFGGLLRSEFRVPGLKDSITTEPYQPLQLDIGSPDVRNVVDALRGLTRPERLQGDFNSPRGKDITATKQVFIESLPPVLILHLKRFQFDAEGHGTVKIWKKIGYPLELEIPREAISRQRRQIIGDGPMPRYKLISVVYHHGKNASGGHYTVDVRRQDGREWIRMDDTVLRRIRSEDVAQAGSEEEVKDIRRESSPASGGSSNRFGVMNDEDTGDEDGWKQVTASASGNKKLSNVVNGAGNASNEKKQAKDNIKDNKVAYLLFYQRM
ncbi:hypothetical protein QQS21_008415 [Conoideocrella luteorostrata]|uniref:Ubiquitin carboxyl-terminal hydrolase n=1 Tax=Conoideocrella luteorostrata TaxID=1105319 RepID=A0AAJ0FYQ2_9HYPO|nr:hypothetical protein QQS21_008415 [Conoideocrella luteorostrata]